MTTAIVVDASVAVKWLVPESDSDVAERLLSAAYTLHAPRLLKAEVANSVWKHVVKKNVGRDFWKVAHARLERSIDHWHDCGSLLDAAVEMGCIAAHPIYDFVYLALARTLSVPLISADKRFLSKAPAGAVIALEDWRP